jgi:hypothetical protein
MVQLSAEPNPVANVQAALAYEMWFVRDDGQGHLSTDLQQGFVAQGDLAHVTFGPRLWPIPGTACIVQAEVVTDFRGLIGEDGLIDVSVEPQRTFSLVLGDRVATYSRRSPGGGRKTLTVKPDEVIELVLPEPIERFSNARCGATQGTIDMRTAFPGQKTSLIMKVRKAS